MKKNCEDTPSARLNHANKIYSLRSLPIQIKFSIIMLPRNKRLIILFKGKNPVAMFMKLS